MEDNNSPKPINNDTPLVTPSAPEVTGDSPKLNQSPPEVQGDPQPSRRRHETKLVLSFVVLVVIVAVAAGIYYEAHNNKKPSSTVNAATTKALYAPSQVDITSTGFVPATVSVKPGQAVVWTNHDTAPHIVASDPYPSDNTLPGLNSVQQLTTNDSYTYIFNHTGTFTYHDNLNPSLEGTVVVKSTN